MRRGGLFTIGAAALALLLPASSHAGTERADQRLEKSLSSLVAMPDGPRGAGVAGPAREAASLPHGGQGKRWLIEAVSPR